MAKTIEAMTTDQPPITTVHSLATVTAKLPAVADDYGDDAGLGMEDVTQQEMLLPIVRIVQPTSGVLKEGNASYNETAKQGMIYNTASGDYYTRKNGFGFVPCFRQGGYTEWVPYDQGGGFRGNFPHDDPRVEKLVAEHGRFKPLPTGNGTELHETYSAFGVIVPIADDGTWLIEQAMPGVIVFASTQIKKYRSLVTRLNMMTGQAIGRPHAPMFAWRWKISTVPEKTPKGDIFGWHIELADPDIAKAKISKFDPLYAMAKEVHLLVAGGGAKVDYAQTEMSDGGSSATIDMSKASDAAADEIPF